MFPPGYSMILICPVYVPAGMETGAVMLTVIGVDVVQQSAPFGEICNQFPPVPVEATAEKLSDELVLVIARDCDEGSMPPTGIEKLSETGEATKPGSPTTTLTGMVTPSAAEASKTWPV